MPNICEHDGCTKYNTFGTEGGKGRFCCEHKEEGMVDVKNKRCEHVGCIKLNPCFGVEGGKGVLCAEHKKEGMVDVKNKRCKHEGCSKHPYFDMDGGKGQFCVLHKTAEMVNVRNKRCEHAGCTTYNPSFDMKGGKGQFCAKHKKEGMVNVVSKLCEHNGCAILNPKFDKEGEKGRFCFKHKKECMVNVKNKRCITCPITVSRKEYKGYCYRCFIHTFPDNDIVKNHKTKERHVADFIRENFPEYDLSFDRRIEGGCSKRRPDIFIDIETHMVIIEIDENQHNSYDCSCEHKRLMELFMDAGGNRPIVMVRFNPDGYNTYDNKRVTSCWGITEDKGLCKVKKSKQTEWLHRLDALKNAVRSACMEDVKKEVDVVHLFYDEVLQSS